MVERHFSLRKLIELFPYPVRRARSPHAELARERLARSNHVLIASNEVRSQLLVDALFVREIEIVDVARIVLALSQSDSRIASFEKRAAHGGDLHRRLEIEVRSLHVEGRFEHRVRDAGLRRIELRASDAFSSRDREDADEVFGHREVSPRRDITAPRRDRKFEAAAEDRVLEETRLHEIRLRDAQILEGSLEMPVVEQRDLDGAVDRQLARKKSAETACSSRVLFVSLIPMDLAIDPRANEPRGVLKRRFRRGRRATRQRKGENEQNAHVHREPSCEEGIDIPGMDIPGIDDMDGAADAGDEAVETGLIEEPMRGASAAFGLAGSLAFLGGKSPSAHARKTTQRAPAEMSRNSFMVILFARNARVLSRSRQPPARERAAPTKQRGFDVPARGSQIRKTEVKTGSGARLGPARDTGGGRAHRGG